MKKLLIVLLAVLTIASCQKKETDPGVTQQDVSFAALNVTADAGLKSTNDFPNCPDDMGVPVSAEIIIDGVTYTPQVFELDGKWYTQSIKLEVVGDNPVTYEVTSFVLLDATGAIMAIPAASAAYSEYTDPDVPFDITVNKFAKAEVPVQVLCYQEADYDNFGFNWFEITQLVIREQCFFGDICLNGDPFTPADFNNTLYGSDLPVDVPAIMQVRVYKGDVIPTNQVPNSPFDNETTLGIGAPLCVQYPDNINLDGEVFTFELYLWLPDANGWSYQLYATYTATDDGPLSVDVGDDGVLDFVVGSCNYSDTDDEFDFIYIPPVPPVVEAGWESATKKLNARWRNLRIDGNGGEIYVGTDCGNSATRSEVEFYQTGSQYFFAPDANSIYLSYDPNTGILSTSTTVDNEVKNLDYSVGNVGLIDYMQWQVNGDPGKILEFNNVQLTVDGQTYNLGNFQTEYGDWNINYDLSSGFSLTGEMVINGQATNAEGMRLEITVGEL